MMNDNWLNDLRNKMADYETDEPEQLWDRIEAQLPPVPGAQKRVPLTRRWKTGIAVAAMAIVTLGLGMAEYARRNANQTEQASLQKTAQATLPDHPMFKALPHESTPASPKAMPERRRPATKPLAAVIQPARPTVEASQTKKTPAPAEAKEAPSPAQKETSPKQTNSILQKQNRPILSTRQPKRGRGYRRAALSMDLFTTGGTGFSALHSYSQLNAAPSTGVNNAQWKDSPMLGILLYNQGQQTTNDIQHRLPVKAGFTLEYKLNEHISLASGITYTNLVSDLREGSQNHYCKGTQRLHYVGLPLTVKYRILSWGRIDVYGAASLLAEQCVSGRIDNDYVLNNTVVQHKGETISEKPFQLSANLSAGLQCNLTRTVALYAEPGLSYYFDDGSTLSTIYKEKPANFNLNLGIRLAFGKKSPHTK